MSVVECEVSPISAVFTNSTPQERRRPEKGASSSSSTFPSSYFFSARLLFRDSRVVDTETVLPALFRCCLILPLPAVSQYVCIYAGKPTAAAAARTAWHTHVHTLTHTHSYLLTHTHTRTRTHTHTHTHTHAHTPRRDVSRC